MYIEQYYWVPNNISTFEWNNKMGGIFTCYSFIPNYLVFRRGVLGTVILCRRHCVGNIKTAKWLRIA